jgi:hypothetical protein
MQKPLPFLLLLARTVDVVLECDAAECELRQGPSSCPAVPLEVQYLLYL